MKTNPDDQIVSVAGMNISNKGLSKREYFAAMAMQSFLNQAEHYDPEEAAVRAIKAADDLIEELNKG